MASRNDRTRMWLSSLTVLAVFSQPSTQQRDPVKDFCRRFGHQTAVVDNKLYVDGGFLNYKPMSSNPGNYTNTWLAWHDLDTIHEGMPKIHVDLSKNATIPSVHGGALWADDVNYRLFLFGGEFADVSPTTLNLMSYDIWYDQWDNFGPPANGIQRVSYGASTNVAERGEGYYFGGYLSNSSAPRWAGDRLATNGMVRYDFDDNSWTNITGPDDVGRAEGVMTFIPASDSGMLVYFGGVKDYRNGTLVPSPMDEILIFDVVSTKWHTQTATGDIPENRRKFCAGSVWPEDKSSYNIYLNSGEGFSGPGYDDVYILTIPTFKWIKTYPLNVNGTGLYPSHSLTCNVVRSSQMLTIGGSFPLDQTCDYEGNQGVHNIDLGDVIPDNFENVWAGYDPDLKGYKLPSFVTDVIGGNADGGATKTTPDNGFGNPDLAALLKLTAAFDPRTRKADGRTPPPTATPSSSSSSSSNALSKGAIIGIAVGGSVALIALLAGTFLLCRRWRRRRGSRAPPPPAEMSSTPLTPYAHASPYNDSQLSPYPHGYAGGGGGSAGGYSPGQHPPFPNYYYQPGGSNGGGGGSGEGRTNWSWTSSPANSPPVPTSSTSPRPTRSEMDASASRPVELDGAGSVAGVASPGAGSGQVAAMAMRDDGAGWVDEMGRPVQGGGGWEYGVAK